MTTVGPDARVPLVDDPILLIISSPSGAGKTTLTHKFLEDAYFADFGFSVSHTTRKPRRNEVEGQDYHFVDEADFQARIDHGDFLEWAKVHGNFYGTSLSELARARDAGKGGLLFDVDYQGARQIRAKVPNAVAVFILPPSLGELKRRLERRASDDPDVIERRYQKAKVEIEHYPFFDYLIVNEEIDRALAQLKGIVHAERCRRYRLADRAEALLRE